MEFITLLVLLLFTDMAGSIAPGFFHGTVILKKLDDTCIDIFFSPEWIGKILVEFSHFKAGGANSSLIVVV